MAYTFNTELGAVATNYVNALNAKVTNKTISEEIEEHPYYPSLLSLSDTFSRYKILNSAFVVTKAEFQNLIGETPFVAFTKIDNVGDDFVLVTEITDTEIKYLHKNDKVIQIPIEHFLSNFKEIIWKAELHEESGQINFEEKLKEEKRDRNKNAWLVLGGIFIFLSILVSNTTDTNIIQLSIIALIKLVGVIVSSFIVSYEINKNNAFVKQLCKFNTKTDCEAVLSSNASKIFGMSWGDIGLLYFVSTLFGLLIPTVPFNIKIAWIAIGNLVALPYTIFSIYYQWKIIKQWCVFCLAIQAVLIAELIYSLTFIWSNEIPYLLNINNLITIFFAFITSMTIWYYIKPILRRNNDHDLYQKAYKRLLYNPDIFENLLEQQPIVNEDWQNLGIDIGNPNATRTVIKVCNPYCNPCDQAHPILENLIESNHNVKLKIIYITKNDELDKGRFITRHLLAIAENESNESLQKALDDWYKNPDIGKKYEVFKDKYPQDEEIIESQSIKIDAMRKWIDTASITHTPTIFVDGYRLPENYEISELKYIL